MEIKVKQIEAPNNYLSETQHEYHSTALSFHKFCNGKLDVKYWSEPELLIEQRSGEWFGPVLLISSMAISENPALISITCSVIANYVTDFFQGTKRQDVRLKFIHKKMKTSTLTEITYEGDINGIDKLEASILKVINQENEIE